MIKKNKCYTFLSLFCLLEELDIIKRVNICSKKFFFTLFINFSHNFFYLNSFFFVSKSVKLFFPFYLLTLLFFLQINIVILSLLNFWCHFFSLSLSTSFKPFLNMLPISFLSFFVKLNAHCLSLLKNPLEHCKAM